MLIPTFSFSLFSVIVVAGLLAWARNQSSRMQWSWAAISLTAYLLIAIYGEQLSSNDWVSNTLVLLGAASIAILLARFVPNRSSLISFLLAAAIVDWLSFSDGLTRSIIQAAEAGNAHLLSMLTISAHIDSATIYILGIGDLVIIGIVFLALRNMAWKPLMSILAPLSGLLIAILIGLYLGPISAIPLIAASTLTALFIQSRSKK